MAKFGFMRKITLFVAVLAMLSMDVYAQVNDYAVRLVKDGLYIPWEMVNGPNNEIWFTQKNGIISRLNPTNGQMKVLADLTDSVYLDNGEGGMLGLALHPGFNDTPNVYFVYNYPPISNPLDKKEKVVIYTYANDTLTYKSTIVDNIEGYIIHNGSRLLIVDQHLYVTTGDANVPASAQDLSSPNGKILRYNLDGSIPADNPVAGSPVWSFGHRNPQGLCMMGNVMVSSEHGPNADDEINIIRKNRNYGWPNVEGYCNTPAEQSFCSANNVQEPARTWTPTLAVCGIDYYTHGLFPQWTNKLLMATLKDSRLYAVTFNAAKDSVINAEIITDVNKGRLRDVLMAPDGRIYICTGNFNPSPANNAIYEIYDPTPSGIEELTAGSIGVQPNPSADGVFEVRSGQHGALKARVVDPAGRLIREQVLDRQQSRIDLSAQPQGLYFLQLFAADGHALGVRRLLRL